ncbi:tubulin-tyrosine ligase [Gigaspora margarita]|uniref:Tubulin-tyrosine ligase n=1 Tax=Gigaspora margarita TaxID=4874 RepID=A0A8H3X2N1_GIGMA|nr:tubulin-tyrosine ligase [Gigaspora margarita]
MAQEIKESSEQLPAAIIGIRDQYTRSIIINSFKTIIPIIQHYTPSSAPSLHDIPILFWSEYEDIDFSQILTHTKTHLANSYCIRKVTKFAKYYVLINLSLIVTRSKGLIRKAQMNFNIQKYVAKYPNSCLKKSIPETWFFEIDHVDYIDEALDEIFEVVQECKENESRERKHQFILKPNLGNKGADIKIFNSIEQLKAVFEVTLEESNDDIDAKILQNDEIDESMFHLREWVIQRYISDPLLINGRKFHIRAYVLAVSKIRVYLYKDMLALFALHTYKPDDINDIFAHLTNTCLQIHDESFKESDQVKLFWELMQYSPEVDEKDLNSIFEQIKNILGECFKAVVSEVTQFMPLENAFELFGFDFLVDTSKNVYLLEANSFPDFKQTGARLSHVISHLFENTIKLAVIPFFEKLQDLSINQNQTSDETDSKFCLVFKNK